MMEDTKKALTKDWWLLFIEENFSFTETKVFKDVLSESLQENLYKGVKEMLQSRINRLDISNGFRLYQKGEEIGDSKVRKLIRENKLESQESIESYCKRIFGENYGIITNYGERHSDILAENVLEAIQPLFDIIGIPPWGVELTTFIGNYGWTPLGIHTDQRGENVLHFHLGPGKKTMYTWNEDVYKEVGKGVSNNKDVEPLLEYAQKYEFGRGDLYYMPWNKHHIGFSGDFSIGVTLWFNNPTKCSFSKLMIESIKNMFLKDDMNIIESQLDYLNNEQTFNDFIGTLNISSKTLNEPLVDFLQYTYKEYKKCLLSNGGWQNIPLRHHKKVENTNHCFPEFEFKKIVGSNVFKITHEKEEDRLLVYVRGVRLSFKYFEGLVKIIDMVNTGKVIEVQDVIEEIDDLPKDVVVYFLKTLVNNRGLKIQEAPLAEIQFQ
ncbi:hypothetical protein [Zobellia uliginosa]|uniref:hypothetical protein n=1 Tax=Zobellia uliginosa TaxID=143224 RepID=UPI0026E1146A|nr:hypothetical protein [Zobellia uliginosa]MDO6518590.1 hypothetical protein [Zobellia uliginosa]